MTSVRMDMNLTYISSNKKYGLKTLLTHLIPSQKHIKKFKFDVSILVNTLLSQHHCHRI